MQISKSHLAAIRAKHRSETIVFCSGSFDLTHAGHVLFLEGAKGCGDILVVGIGKDETIKSHKAGGRPILNEPVRLKVVDSLKPVDYTFLTDKEPDGQSRLAPFEEIFELLGPDVWFMNNDIDDTPEREALAKRHGVAIIIADRICPPEFDKISTTKIIKKIKNLEGKK